MKHSRSSWKRGPLLWFTFPKGRYYEKALMFIGQFGSPAALTGTGLCSEHNKKILEGRVEAKARGENIH